MGLSQALISAIAGLNANQSALAMVSANVANSGTAGYVRKTVNQVEVAGGSAGISVRVSQVQREIDAYVQKQLRVENSGASYATTRADIYNQLQDIYGAPGSDSTLETAYNNFTSSLQALSSSPDDQATRASVISTAQQLTQQLNSMSSNIQGLRGGAELGISDAVAQANDAMSHIAQLNGQLAGMNTIDATAATLLDQRDAYIDKLSQLMDINVVQGNFNQVNVFTNSGVQLVGTTASTLAFNAQGTVSAGAQWDADPNKSGVGTITLTSPNGSAVDLIQNNAIRSGSIAAYVQMRDQDLVQAQGQLDAIATAMASALSDKTTQGTAVTSGAQQGFDIDIGGLASGNKVTINYTDSLTNTPRTITLVRVDDPGALPLSDAATATAGDKVYGIDFSGGMAGVYSQIAQAIGSTGMVASNPTGTTLRVLNDGPGNVVTVNGVSTTTTETSLMGGSSQLPLFTDGATAYTGSFSSTGAQSTGFASRIAVNATLAGDPSKLVTYQAGVAAGDSRRPDFILQQLTGSSLQFSPSSGIGTAASPFSGSISTFLRQVISQQGQAADAANSLKQGQDVVQSSLQQRFDDTSGVNMDEELANLLQLQNAYAANARVLSAVKDMIDTLMKL